MTPESTLIFNKPFSALPEEFDYELLSPFFAIRRNQDKIEIIRAGYHEEGDYYKE